MRRMKVRLLMTLDGFSSSPDCGRPVSGAARRAVELMPSRRRPPLRETLPTAKRCLRRTNAGLSWLQRRNRHALTRRTARCQAPADLEGFVALSPAPRQRPLRARWYNAGYGVTSLSDAQAADLLTHQDLQANDASTERHSASQSDAQRGREIRKIAFL